MPPEQKEEISKMIDEKFASFIRSDRFTFEKLIQILDGRNIQVGRTTGTRIGIETGQRIAFHNATPVVQAGAITAPSGGGTQDAEARTAINAIRTVLSDKGFTA